LKNDWGFGTLGLLEVKGMKLGTIVVVFLFASLSYAEDETKTIRVDKTTFSAVYPAVWFSPSTGC